MTKQRRVRSRIIMDPFPDSGQVAVASKAKGRRYVGFGIAPDYCEFARARLESGEYLIRQAKKAAASLWKRRLMW